MAADDVDPEVAAGRVADGGGDLDDLPVGVQQPVERPHGRSRGPRAVSPVRVDDDRGRVERVALARVLEDGQPAHGGDSRRKAAARAGADADPDQRQRGEHEQDHDQRRHHLRALHHPAGVRRPHPDLARVAPLGQAARQHPQVLQPLAEGHQHHRQQRQRADHGHDRDDEAADSEAAQERNGQQQHQREADRHGETAEQDRPAGVQHRLLHGFPVLQAAAALVAVAVDDEQRVVDGDAEPDHQHHVAEVVAQLQQVRRAPGDAECRRDGGGGEQEGQQRRPGAEDEQQDQERGRNGEVQLPDLQVVREHRREVVLDGRVAGDEDVSAEPLTQLADPAGRAVACQLRCDERRGRARREPLDVVDPAARQEPACLLGGAAHARGGVVVLRDQHVDRARADVVALGEHLGDAGGVGAGKREAALQQRRQPERRHESERDHHEPDRCHEQPVPEREGGDARERAEFAARQGHETVTAVRIGIPGASLKGDRAERERHAQGNLISRWATTVAEQIEAWVKK